MIRNERARMVMAFLCLTIATIHASPMVAQGQSLIAHLPLDGGGNDVSGNGNHGAVNGAQGTSNRFGGSGRAMFFDGVDDYVRVADNTQFRSQEITISVWVKFCEQYRTFFSEPVSPIIVGKGGIRQGVDYYAIFVHWNGRIGAEAGRAGGGMVGEITQSFLNDGRWHHCVMATGPGTQSGGFWVDGVNLSNRGMTFGAADLVTSDLYIARNVAANRYFRGAIDDVRIYNAKLGDAQVQALYTEGGWPNTTYPSLGVQIAPPPALAICPGDSVPLRAVVTGSPDRLIWRSSLESYLRDSSSPSITARPGVTTTYSVVVTQGEPCPERRDSTAITITVRPGPKLPRLGPYVICPGDSARIGGAAFGGTPPYRYQWRAAPGIVNATDSTQRVSPATSRWYHVEVVDANNCRHRDSALVAVPGYPKLALPARRVICRGRPDTIGVAATGGSGGSYRYRWSPSAGLSEDSVAYPLMLADTTRRYVVEVIDGNGCSARDTIDVIVVDPPVAEAGDGVSICVDSSATLGAPGAVGLRYRWTPVLGLNDTTLAQPTARPDTTTTYRVEVTDTTTGCVSTDTVEVRVVRLAMAATPARLDFGRLDGCTSSVALSLMVRNRGDGPVTISGAVGATHFVVGSGSLPVVLNPGDTAWVDLRYAPQGSGFHVDTLVLMADRCGIVERIVLVGAKDAAIARVAPNTIDLGARLVCDTSVARGVAWVRNLGGDPMTISNVASDTPFTTTSITLPSTIGPGDSLAIAFRLPILAGVWSGEGRIAYASGSCRDTLRVTLRGEVVAPSLAVPDPLDIGLMTGCGSHFDTTVMVSNATSLPMTIARIDGGAIVSSQQSLPMTIDPASATSVRLRIRPTQHGPFSQQVTVGLAECDTEITFTVSGDYRGVFFTHVDTVDFGQVVACGDTTVSLPFELTYGGGAGAAGRVVSATIDAPFAVDPITGASLDSGVVYRTGVHFTPSGDGAFNGRLRLALEPCGSTREVVLMGSRSSARLVAEPPVLDLGMVNPGVTAIGVIIYVNRGTVPVRVESINGIAPPFAIRQTVPSLPSSVSPGDTLRVIVEYTAQRGRWIDTAEAITSEPCRAVAQAEIRAGTNDALRARLTADRLVATAGDHRRLTITLSDGAGLASAGVRTIETTLRFDGSLLYVQPNQAGVTDLGDSSGWTLVRVRQSLPSVGGEAAGVNVVALLGRRDRTEIVIEEARWLDASDQPIVGIATTIEAGEFALEGVCRQGSDRYVDGLGEFFLRPVIPTPTQGVGAIEFGLVEDGEMRLDVVDMQGRSVGTLLEAAPGPGVYRVTVDARGLSAGRYVVILRVGRRVETVRMVVKRQ